MNEPLRIAQVMGKWLGGGVESVVMNYYRNIDRSAVQFDFICDSDSTDIPYDEIESLGGRVFVVPPYQKVFAYRKALVKLFKENGYKIVHSHLNTLSVFPLSAAKKAGIKIRIAHSHSTSNKKEFKRNVLKKILRPWTNLFATEYFCCSEVAGRWQFGDRVYDGGNVFLLRNAIDLEKFRFNEEKRTAKRKELGIPDDVFVIGHIGRFMAQKNHAFLIDIFKKVHEQDEKTMMLLAGQGPLFNEVKEYADSLGLGESVKFLGQRSDVADLYQAFDVFVLPSLYEGLGIVLIEGQASGLKCLASNAVPSEAAVSEYLSFLPLDDNELWGKEILKICGYERKCFYSEISNHGYDIKTNSLILKEKYLSF